MQGDRLTISVEVHSEAFSDLLDESRLTYRVFKSSRRWLFLTDYLPEPVSSVTAAFLHRTVLPEMLIEHLDETYDDLDDEDRTAVFRDNLPVLETESFRKGTQAALLPSIEERKGISIQGWLRFRGDEMFRPMVAELSRAALRDLRLHRAFQQFRSLRRQPVDVLCIEGQGPALRVTDGNGRELYREFLDGYLDDRLEIAREDLAWNLIQALRPETVRLDRVDPAFARMVRNLMSEAVEG